MRKIDVELSLLLKVIGIGVLVAVSAQILGKTGRDEQVTWLTVAGIVVVFLLLLGEIGGIVETVERVFGLG